MVVVPPGRPQERAELGALVGRLEELVRWLRGQQEEFSGDLVRFGSVEVEPLTQTIRRNGRRVTVTRTEFRVLYALLRRRGEVVRREELAAEVWGPEVRLRSRVIDTHIARLRRKLEDDPTRPRHIRTAPYRGYRFDIQGG
jgi:two-component system KDP operon response regulator KdpE